MWSISMGTVTILEQQEPHHVFAHRALGSRLVYWCRQARTLGGALLCWRPLRAHGQGCAARTVHDDAACVDDSVDTMLGLFQASDCLKGENLGSGGSTIFGT